MQLVSVLPQGIAEVIARQAQHPRQAERLARLARYVIGKFIADGIDFEDSIEISREHFRGQIGSHYLPDLNALRSAGVISSDDTYTLPKTDPATGKKTALGRCKRYTLARDLVFTDPELVTISESNRKRFDLDFVTRETVTLLARLTLTIDARNLKRYVAGFVTPEYIRARCRINGEIPPGEHTIKGLKYPLNLDRILEIAQRSKVDAILYRDRVYLAQAERFLADRLSHTRVIYLDSLVKIKEIRKRPNIVCARNETNRRLDTNLTNFKNELLGLIRLDGERLFSIDLKNSQPTLLAYLLEAAQDYIQFLDNKYFSPTYSANTDKNRGRASYLTILQEIFHKSEKGTTNQHPFIKETIVNVTQNQSKKGQKTPAIDWKSSDLELFKNSTKAGTFYEDFADRLGDAGKTLSREETKRILFLVLFSSRRYNPPEKRLLAEHYPSLVAFTNGFKRAMSGFYEGEGLSQAEAREKGDASLAVALQRIESEIFIDGILARLLREGYRVFSKHDSILCKESDLDQVLAIVTAELDRELAPNGYRLKVSPT